MNYFENINNFYLACAMKHRLNTLQPQLKVYLDIYVLLRFLSKVYFVSQNKFTKMKQNTVVPLTVIKK